MDSWLAVQQKTAIFEFYYFFLLYRKCLTLHHAARNSSKEKKLFILKSFMSYLKYGKILQRTSFLQKQSAAKYR